MTHLFIPQNRQELRDWLTKNAEILNVAWIVIDREQSNLTYLDIVEEALCFGWIDSTKKKLSDTATAQRLSPRTKKVNGLN